MNQQTALTDILYVGTYSVRGSRGLYVYAFDRATGTVELVQAVDNPNSPSFLALHPSGHFLYAVNERDEQGDEHFGTVYAYAIDPQSGHLTFINQQVSLGKAPCHISIHQSGKLAFVSNYGSGSLAVLPIREDGSLAEATQLLTHTGSSVDEERQDAPHVHSATLSPDGRWLYASDLGTDKVHAYRVDADQHTLSPHETPYVAVSPGSGPRITAVHPDGRHVYGIKEMSSTVAVFTRHPETDAFALLQDDVPFLPEQYEGERSGGDIHVDAAGRYLYTTNRGNNTLAIFRIGDNGALSPVGLHYTGGDQPRNFWIDPNGDYVLVAHEETDNITVFKRDKQTGDVAATGYEISVPSPVCLVMLARP
ncbi:6-phosphogluconolactonase [Fibrisoma limi BUZ 3]|uniref:6-phosphogluconolactonase n=1 Tax=Fibrisoma limi BUZ 3 TaxID=1185876 RepID=I2GG75_9BACT|nr:lactonase family protein [Fibrisoma limi]CCH52900.1 6-phosphogluconolactonase [Fibrisoma limi BUZ 3]